MDGDQMNFEVFWKIYDESFPADEKRSRSQQLEIMKDPNYSLYPILMDDREVGFIAYWHYNEFLFIEHYALSVDARSQGIGSTFLEEFLKTTEKPVILEVEPPTEDIQFRRISFYERLGFTLSPYTHIQKAYVKGRSGVKLQLMAYPEAMGQPLFEIVEKRLFSTLYKPEDETMNYTMTFHPKSEQKTSRWSGGTTTQLWIWPEDSSYVDRTFQFRISTAVVEAEKSDFTLLQGYDRYLMTLDSPLKIRHNQEKWTTINPYVTHAFSGGWETQSEGSVTDFNVMVREGLLGQLEAIHFEGAEEKIIELSGEFAVLLYGVKGTVTVLTDSNSGQSICTGDHVLIKAINEDEVLSMTLSLRSEGSGVLVLGRVCFNNTNEKK